MTPNVTRGSDFAELLTYLVDDREHDLIDLCGVDSVALAPAQMELSAAASDRAKSVVMHVSLSAAPEDGRLDEATWLLAVTVIEQEFGLAGHQRVVVRHNDKSYDHIHVFWCTVSMESGRNPPKQWFLKKGSGVEGIGARALTDDEVAAIPAPQRQRKSFDSFALVRLQQLCRVFEGEQGLRRLRSPAELAAAKLRGETRPPSGAERRREARTGTPGLSGDANEIRSALDAPDWAAAQLALAKIGVGMKPAMRKSRSAGDVLRGLVLFDLADPGNQIPASRLDVPDQKYGLRQIEKRHSASAPSFEQWWPTRAPCSAEVRTTQRKPEIARLKIEFEHARHRHLLAELDKSLQRKELRKRHDRELRTAKRVLMRERAEQAARLPSSERRAFYRKFSQTVRGPRLSQMRDEHRKAAHPFRKSRLPTWSEFVAVREVAVRRVASPPSKATQKADHKGGQALEPAHIDKASVIQKVSQPHVVGTGVIHDGSDMDADVVAPAWYQSRKGRGR